MRRVLMVAVMLFAMTSLARAGDGRNWTVQPAASWTVTDGVSVNYSFTENGAPVGTPGVLNFNTQELLHAQLVDGVDFLGSGRTVCLEAKAFRGSNPGLFASASPSCFTFQFGPLEPPIVLTP